MQKHLVLQRAMSDDGESGLPRLSHSLCLIWQILRPNPSSVLKTRREGTEMGNDAVASRSSGPSTNPSARRTNPSSDKRRSHSKSSPILMPLRMRRTTPAARVRSYPTRFGKR